MFNRIHFTILIPKTKLFTAFSSTSRHEITFQPNNCLCACAKEKHFDAYVIRLMKKCDQMIEYYGDLWHHVHKCCNRFFLTDLFYCRYLSEWIRNSFKFYIRNIWLPYLEQRCVYKYISFTWFCIRIQHPPTWFAGSFVLYTHKSIV